jgi:acetylornithine deacetylase
MTTDITPREMLARLVAFPTVSRDTNLPLVDFAADHLARCGASLLRVPDETGTKASLVARIGPDAPGGVVLSGHTDVVPVEGQDWSSDPWRLVERAGRLYGRGTADMKGFVALALALAPAMAAAPLTRPIYLALSRDEEVGCVGAPSMIAAMLGAMPRPEAVIVGEPTSMRVVAAHKAGLQLETRVRGHEVHSSEIHRGVSAIMWGARLVTWLDDVMAENRAAAEAGTGGDPAFDPPYTTTHVGTIEGGTAHNITARDCRFLASFRVLPSEEPDAWEARYRAEADRLSAAMRGTHPAAGIAVERVNLVPSCRPEAGGPAETLARALTGDNATHVVSFGTEAGQFQEPGLSAVICGPGDIAQAHQPDEFITVAQFEEGGRFIRRLIDRLAA